MKISDRDPYTGIREFAVFDGGDRARADITSGGEDADGSCRLLPD
jgi:hypothetical protein